MTHQLLRTIYETYHSGAAESVWRRFPSRPSNSSCDFSHGWAAAAGNKRLCVCRCSVPEGRGSLVISPRRRREGGSPHATTGGSQSTGELTTKGEPPISHTRGRDPAGSLSPQYKSGHVGRDRGSLPY